MPSTRGAGAPRGAARDVLLIVLVLLALGVVGGVVWAQVVTPAEFTRVAHGASMDEDQVARIFGADGWYAVIGVLTGLLAGAVVMWRSTGAELRTTAALLVGSVVAAAAMAVTGHLLGPGDPRAALASAKVGALVPERLSVGGLPLFPLGHYLRGLGGAATVYVAWPFGVLLGALFTLLGRTPPATADRDDGSPAEHASVSA